MKQMTRLATVGIVFVLGCAPPARDLSEADLAAIRERFDEVARHVSAEDNAAWANDFTEDGIFMIGNTPALRGRAAIQKWGEAARAGYARKHPEPAPSLRVPPLLDIQELVGEKQQVAEAFQRRFTSSLG